MTPHAMHCSNEPHDHVQLLADKGSMIRTAAVARAVLDGREARPAIGGGQLLVRRAGDAGLAGAGGDGRAALGVALGHVERCGVGARCAG